MILACVPWHTVQTPCSAYPISGTPGATIDAAETDRASTTNPSHILRIIRPAIQKLPFNMASSPLMSACSCMLPQSFCCATISCLAPSPLSTTEKDPLPCIVPCDALQSFDQNIDNTPAHHSSPEPSNSARTICETKTISAPGLLCGRHRRRIGSHEHKFLANTERDAYCLRHEDD